MKKLKIVKKANIKIPGKYVDPKDLISEFEKKFPGVLKALKDA